MGCGSYSYDAYTTLANERSYATASASSIFKNRSLSAKSDIKTSNVSARNYNTNVKREMLTVGVRESRDTQEHPETTPIIIALDVTGSMRRTPHEMIRNNFPKLMDALMQLGIKDPQLLFMAIGDHEYDSYPIQVGQFESDTERIVNSLEEFVLEGGGGGNRGESYLLAHIVAGYHTETDSWYKRHKKGYLFTIGDEPNLTSVPGRALEEFMGYQKPANSITAKEAVEKAKEQYHVFHIHITDGSHGSRPDRGWSELLGQNVLVGDSHNIHNTIAEAIKEYEGSVTEDYTEGINTQSEDLTEQRPTYSY